MACAFCLTGKMGLVRNLTAGEIVGQVRVLADALDMREPRFNIVLMGMGEPLHNYDETMKALRILADEHGFALPPRRITLSTVGLLPALERLAREPLMPNLAISLHAPTDAQRGELVPLNRKYGVGDIIDACRRFPLKRRSRITFEYVLLAGVNDSPADARRLARLLAGVKSKVNLIPLNAAAGIPFERPSDDAVDRFARILADHGPDRVGPQEPRTRHPGRLRPADRGEPGSRRPTARRSRSVTQRTQPESIRLGSTAIRERPATHSLRARPGGILHLQVVPVTTSEPSSSVRPRWTRPDLRVAERRRSAAGRSRATDARALAHDGARHLPGSADGARCPAGRSTETRARASAATLRDTRPARRSRRRFRRETDDDVRADRGVRACARGSRRPARGTDSRVYGPPHGAQHPIARVLQRQVEVRREASDRATRSTISGVQSIGSSELMRNRTSG